MITRNGYVRQSAGGFRDEEGKKDFAFENENPNSGGRMASTPSML